MTYHDRYGFSLSTQSAIAAERYQEGVDLLLSLWPNAEQTLDSAIDADPDFALAWAARARLHATRAEATLARQKIVRASELANANGSERERSHINTMSLAIHGQSSAALTSALEHLARWPTDVMVFSLVLGAFGLLAFSGMSDHDQARVDLCERYASHFSDDDWWFLTYRGWSHGENGNIQLGRALTERSLEVRRRNVNAAHAFTHVLYEAGEGAEAERFIQAWLPEYDRSGVLYSHIAWHGALLALERGDIPYALDIYKHHVAPSATLGVPINVVSDTASFLWRMQVYGYDVDSGLWQEAAAYASKYFQEPGLSFADIHMAMLATASGDKQAVLERERKLRQLLASGKLPAGPVVPAICSAILAFAEGRYAQCVEILAPVAGEAVRLGGSGAQREIVEDTLVVALMHTEETDKARRMLETRLKRRPSVRDQNWLSSLNHI